MFDLRWIVPKTDRPLLADLRRIAPEDPKQRKLMMAALCLLLLALGIVLWRDRDFWFPDTDEVEFDQPTESSPVAKAAPLQTPAEQTKQLVVARSKHQVARARTPDPTSTPDPPAPDPPDPFAPVAITSRAVLPPLDVEVVAGDTHRTIRPGSSSVRVDLEPGTAAEPVAVPPISENRASGDAESAANLTSDAAERVEMSADASEIVARPVKPNYPLLARQMKVQGSVILQALIGRDGVIQDLRVLRGPHILASAAEDAVRQWHFKPHVEGDEAVETQAKITVNFTISTN